MEDLNTLTIDELQKLIAEAKEQINLKATKIKLERCECVYDDYRLIKYATQIPNIFIYECQAGCGLPRSIMSQERMKQSEIFGERAVFISYNDLVNNNLCGRICLIWDYGLEEKYEIDLADFD